MPSPPRASLSRLALTRNAPVAVPHGPRHRQVLRFGGYNGWFGLGEGASFFSLFFSAAVHTLPPRILTNSGIGSVVERQATVSNSLGVDRAGLYPRVAKRQQSHSRRKNTDVTGLPHAYPRPRPLTMDADALTRPGCSNERSECSPDPGGRLRPRPVDAV